LGARNTKEGEAFPEKKRAYQSEKEDSKLDAVPDETASGNGHYPSPRKAYGREKKGY